MAQPIDTQLNSNAQLTIRATNLGKKFTTGWLFRNFNYTFISGNIYAVTGPNGSGKSTLLQMLWGQLPSTEGTIAYETDKKILELDTLFNKVAIAAPYMDLIDEFTLAEMVDFHFRLKSVWPGYSAQQVIRAMYLEEAAAKPIGNFSSGMKQRLKLGLAFYTDAPVIFLDEPGTNLDDQAFQWYLDLLKKQAANRVVLIASNNKKEYPENTQMISIMDYKSVNC
ncbi:MAG: ABC transporter ATP-binding protein [Flammeovirgaceae bacterium]|nr:MAG: ABC transporter ATP-binding protein [Flammeovirgaceae bacterium]